MRYKWVDPALGALKPTSGSAEPAHTQTGQKRTARSVTNVLFDLYWKLL